MGKNNEITWTGSPDNQAAKVGNYQLIVKNIGAFVNYYEWSLYTTNFKETGYSLLFEDAKEQAIKAMKEHLKTR